MQSTKFHLCNTLINPGMCLKGCTFSCWPYSVDVCVICSVVNNSFINWINWLRNGSRFHIEIRLCVKASMTRCRNFDIGRNRYLNNTQKIVRCIPKNCNQLICMGRRKPWDSNSNEFCLFWNWLFNLGRFKSISFCFLWFDLLIKCEFKRQMYRVIFITCTTSTIISFSNNLLLFQSNYSNITFEQKSITGGGKFPRLFQYPHIWTEIKNRMHWNFCSFCTTLYEKQNLNPVT